MIKHYKKFIKTIFFSPNLQKRVTELDFFRGVALLLMMYFHVVWSMNELYGYQIVYDSGINFIIGRISAILFILISGIVFSFGKFNIKRFLLLAAIAISISAISYIYNSDYSIIFGIIHFFALSSLVAVVFTNMNKYIVIAIGLCILAGGGWINSIYIHSNYLFFIGLVSKTFQSADYYPLIPWFGIYLLGIGLSKIFYKTQKNIFGNIFNFGPINFIGRNTLLFYIIHQPIIIFILYIIDKIK